MSASKDYLSLPLQTFLADLAARSPTPGGGSAAAMVGAVAAAQARMVITYTAGREQATDQAARLHALQEEFARAEDAFGQLMTEDMAAYERLTAARKSDDADERQRAVATASAVPMEIAALAEVVLACLDEVKDVVNRYLLSDLQVAATLAFAAARSAALFVRLNLNDLADRETADELAGQVDQLIARAHQHRSVIVHHESG